MAKCHQLEPSGIHRQDEDQWWAPGEGDEMYYRASSIEPEPGLLSRVFFHLQYVDSLPFMINLDLEHSLMSTG